MARWDWYRGTIHEADPGHVCALLQSAFDLSDVRPGQPKNGYERGAEVARGERVFAWVWWGGNKGICVTGSGENAPAVSDVLRRFEHRVTRADACEDWEEEGLFDRLSGALLDFAQSSRLTINQQGDWIRGRARSLYLGSKSSSCQLVLYEKGDQLGINRPWVRLEARVYPKGDAGYQVASWVPGEAFGASRWMTQALERIGWDHLQAKSVGTVWRPSDALRARLQLVRQYKATLRSWVEEAGSWDAMGAEFELLRDQVESNTLGQEVSDVVLLH